MRRYLVLLMTGSILLAAACGGDDDAGGTPEQDPRTTPSGTPASPASLRPGPTYAGLRAEDTLSGAAAGDFNDDGVLDLAVSAAFADGPEGSRADGGEVYVFIGPIPRDARLVSASEASVTIFGAAAGDQAGRALASGDVDGDGTDDLIIGSPMTDAGPGRDDAGAVHILTGETLPSSGTVDLATAESVAIMGADAQDFLGFTLGAGDLNDDGVADIVAGAFYADGPDNTRTEAGEVTVIHGGAGLASRDLSASPADATVYGGDEGDRLGEALTTGDIDGDGRLELIAVATFAAGADNQRPDSGEVHVIKSPLPETIDLRDTASFLTVMGTDGGDQLGHSIDAADVDGDGTDDLILGAVSADGPENARDLAGEIVLVRTGTGHGDAIDASSLPAMYGDVQGGRLGRAVSGGDLNGDGFADIVAAAPKAAAESVERAGHVYVVYGSPEPLLPPSAGEAGSTLSGAGLGESLGSGIFARPALLTPDIDGDGLADLIAGAPTAGNTESSREGEVRVFYADAN